MRLFCLILIVSLYSCSGEYHLRKAYQKGALTDEITHDTIYDTITVRLDTIIPIYYDSTVLNVKDTIICVDGHPVLIPGERDDDSERVSVTTTLEKGILSTTAKCEAIQDSLEVSMKKNLYYATEVKNIREVNSELTEQLERANDLKARWTIVGVLASIALLLIAASMLLKRFGL